MGDQAHTLDGSFGHDDYQNAQAAAASAGGKATGGGCAECHTGNWIHVRYEYPSEQAVTDAVFVVQKPNGGKPGGEVITEGVLTVTQQSAHEFIHVDLGDYNGEVEVFFYDDPTEPETAEDSGKVVDEKGFFSRVADGIAGTADWAGGVVMGDFNEDMSTGQVITNAVVTMVPGVDQVADIRDLVANGKALVWDRRYGEIAVWVGVFACLIGLVPTLGSLAKGVIKLVWKNADDVGRILIYINKALFKVGRPLNGYRFLKQLADDIPGYVGFVTQKFNDLMDMVSEKIALASRLMPTKVAEAQAAILAVRAMANEKFAEVASKLQAKIAHGLARFATPAHSILPSQSITISRAIKAVIDAGPFTSWQVGMARNIEIEELELGARSIMDSDVAKFIRLRELAETWADDLLKTPGLPSSIKNLDHGILVDVMTTFGRKPTVKIFAEDETMTVYRVIGHEGQIGGPFWSRSTPPSTEEAWRKRDAVLNEWNKGGAYVRSSIPPPDAVLIGEIGPQDLGKAAKAPKLGQMLDGGGEQIWIPRDPKGPASRIDQYMYTEWHAPTAALRAVRSAGKIDECDL